MDTDPSWTSKRRTTRMIWIIFLVEALLLLQLIRVTLRLWRWNRTAGFIPAGVLVVREADGRLRAARSGDRDVIGIALEDISVGNMYNKDRTFATGTIKISLEEEKSE